MGRYETPSELARKQVAAKKLQEALRRLEAIRTKAAKAAASVQAMKAAAGEAERRNDVAVMIRLGRFVFSRAKLDPAFATYCAGHLNDLYFATQDDALMRPVVEALGDMANSVSVARSNEVEQPQQGDYP